MSELENKISMLLSSLGLELYDTELTRQGDEYCFDVFVTKEGGINLDECEKASKLISPLLDLTPPTSGRYFLQVGSPGIERKLRTREHFAKSIGDKVQLVLNNGSKVRGVLQSFANGVATIDSVQIKYDEVSRAKTYFEW